MGVGVGNDGIRLSQPDLDSTFKVQPSTACTVGVALPLAMRSRLDGSPAQFGVGVACRRHSLP